MTAPADWRLGTMGFGYKEWAGPFYPDGMDGGDFLSFYARYFNAVELDTTVYGTPPVERVEKWAASVSEGFRFCTKSPRLITHELGPARAGKAMEEFVGVMRRGLREKLGVIVLQYPPWFAASEFETLDAFLEGLPGDLRFAVELRDRSWGTAETLAMLRERRVCLVSAEYLTRPAKVRLTTDFAYVRWVGEHGRFGNPGRDVVDVSESLAWWAENLKALAAEVNAVWGFFNDDFSGFAVATCERFKRLIGLEVKERERQPGLFG